MIRFAGTPGLPIQNRTNEKEGRKIQMPPTHEILDPYCAKCLAPASETAEVCARCRTPFVGSGAYELLRGPRPSRLFAELYASLP